MKLIRPIALALLLVLPAPAALASHGRIHPTFRTEQVYFHCSGPTKVYQVNWLAGLADPSTAVPWDTTPPSGSVQSGAGCGGLDWGGTTNAFYDPAFSGTFTGNLRDLTVRLHNLATSRNRTGASLTLRLYAEIDGIPLFPPGAQPANGRTVTVTPVAGNSGATDLFEFSITNIGYARDVLDADGNVIDVETGGAALEEADGTIEHTLTLYIGTHGTAFGQDPAGYRVDTWVWDTTEVPSGMTFNPGSLAAAKVAADLPVYAE